MRSLFLLYTASDSDSDSDKGQDGMGGRHFASYHFGLLLFHSYDIEFLLLGFGFGSISGSVRDFFCVNISSFSLYMIRTVY
ncbi:hypothetical protein BJX61DRAFT_183362 [Aspergillus egyptiacus]|nr:hypothetical protein BJX61DRAFT_183362 [Aspergillus egyptiacus]